MGEGSAIARAEGAVGDAAGRGEHFNVATFRHNVGGLARGPALWRGAATTHFGPREVFTALATVDVASGLIVACDVIAMTNEVQHLVPLVAAVQRDFGLEQPPREVCASEREAGGPPQPWPDETSKHWAGSGLSADAVL